MMDGPVDFGENDEALWRAFCHDARVRDDATNKARVPSLSCGGTWVADGREPR